MDKLLFKSLYRLNFKSETIAGRYVFTTQVFHRANNILIDDLQWSKSIAFVDSWISDSNSQLSLISWTYQALEEEIRRGQFDHFVRIVPIDDFFPLDRQSNPDLSGYYQ